MKIVKKTIVTILTILLVSLCLFNLYNFINTKILKKDISSLLGYTLLEVVSGSMEPTLQVGDYIIINTKETDYKINDIVTFYDVNGSFVTHRIVNNNESEIITKGDNNNTEDEPTKKEKIVGKYLFKIKGLGKIISALKSPITIILIFVIGLLICYFLSIDDNGNPILTKDEKLYIEFLKEKKKIPDQENKIKETKTQNVKNPKNKASAKRRKKKKRKKRKKNR